MTRSIIITASEKKSNKVESYYVRNKIGGMLFSSFTAAFFLIMMDNGGPKLPEAQKGDLDWSTWDYKHDGLVKLDGQWKFYWYQPRGRRCL
jgi:hypothetical protein